MRDSYIINIFKLNKVCRSIFSEQLRKDFSGIPRVTKDFASSLRPASCRPDPVARERKGFITSFYVIDPDRKQIKFNLPCSTWPRVPLRLFKRCVADGTSDHFKLSEAARVRDKGQVFISFHSTLIDPLLHGFATLFRIVIAVICFFAVFIKFPNTHRSVLALLFICLHTI
jgi:hypothetical protein